MKHSFNNTNRLTISTFIVSILSIFNINAADRFTRDGIVYQVLSGNTVEALWRIDDDIPSNLVIPSTINLEDQNYKVVSIGNGLLYQCNRVESVVIPNSVTTIESYAFAECENLHSVILGENVETIGLFCFAWNPNLKSIEIPNSVVDMDEGFTFVECSGLESVKISDSLKTIGENCFESCKNLKTIIWGNSVETIEERAFSMCKSLENLELPENIKNIGSFAFYNCSGLNSIFFPTSLESIEDLAFLGCTSISKIDLPASVTNLGSGAFADCQNLTQINVSAENEIYRSVDGAVYNKDLTKLISWPAGLMPINILNSTVSIYSYACAYCKSAISIDIPASVKTIGNSAFYICSSLESVTCRALEVPEIGNLCFAGYNTIPTLYVYESVVEDYKNSIWANSFDSILPIVTDAGINEINNPDPSYFRVYNTNGINILNSGDKADIDNLPAGLYIINGKKVIIGK